MNVIACYKIVPDEQSIVIDKNRGLNFDNAQLAIGQYDLNALEAGAQFVEKHAGALTALTVGGPEVENSKLRKSVLSRGPAKCVTVNDPSLIGADCATISKTLSEAVRGLEGFDLILCGEGSSDLYSQQVGVQLGERLGVSAINSVTSIDYDGEKLLVSRVVDGETENLTVLLPAVLSVASGINATRVPSMREILAAGKKSVSVLTGADVSIPADPSTVTVDVLAPAGTDRLGQIFQGDDADTVAELHKAISAMLK